MAHPLSEPTRFRNGKTKKCGQRGTRFGSDGPVAAEQRFRDALKALVAALGELPSPGMIIGGVAVIAAGVPRQTIDIDATVPGRTSELNVVLKALHKHGIVPRIEDAREFARHSQILLLVHVESSVTIELSFAWLPFEEEALEKALIVDIDGLPVRVARPEDLVSVPRDRGWHCQPRISKEPAYWGDAFPDSSTIAVSARRSVSRSRDVRCLRVSASIRAASASARSRTSFPFGVGPML